MRENLYIFGGIVMSLIWKCVYEFWEKVVFWEFMKVVYLKWEECVEERGSCCLLL